MGKLKSINGTVVVMENGSFTLPAPAAAKEAEAPEAAAAPPTGKDFSSLVPKGLTTSCSDIRDVAPEELGNKPIPAGGVSPQQQKGLVYG